jgi:hypothetical protein
MSLQRIRLVKHHGMRPLTSLRKALNDPALLGNALIGPSWLAWRVLLIASMGEHLTAAELALFKQLTGRDRAPEKRVEEFVGVVGRRGGKSRAISVIATYISGLCKHSALAPGETGIVLVIAPDQKQADIVLDYIEANFRASKILGQLIDARTARSLRLTNRIEIEVRASDFRRLRGPTFIAVIADESAFWLNESSANPDSEILNAVRPGLATTRGPLFLISSPYARRGELWRLYKQHFGPNGDPSILVAQGASRIFNPTLAQSVVDRAVERDPSSAAAEYLAEFRRDIESFIAIEAVQACVAPGVRERPPQRGVTYHGFVDPSGGSADSMTLAIGHNEIERQTVIIDALREVRAPFSPEQVVSEFAQVLATYRVSKITGDRYAGEWPREQFGKFGITYEPSAKSKSELYVDLLPLINSGRIELPDHPKLISQLCGLERRTARGGKDSIDHAPGGHDDVANAVAGLAAFNLKYGSYDFEYRGWDDDPDDPDGKRAWRRMELARHIARYG